MIATSPLAAAPATSRIGLQLYTVRTLFQRDPVGTLEQVAAAGYQEVEFGGGGYLDMDPAMLRRSMERFSLVAPSVHIGYDALLNRLNASVATAEALGADTVVLPNLPPALRTAVAWPDVTIAINRIAERLAKAGLGFAYHNHDFEFVTAIDGDTLYARLIRDCDRELVKFELDVFWAVAAKMDVEALVRRLAGRIYAYHVKDRSVTGDMVAVGAGTIDFAHIFALNRVAGVRHIYVENDDAPAPYIPDIRASARALRRLRPVVA